jgi:hypothetical protein
MSVRLRPAAPFVRDARDSTIVEPRLLLTYMRHLFFIVILLIVGFVALPALSDLMQNSPVLEAAFKNFLSWMSSIDNGFLWFVAHAIFWLSLFALIPLTLFLIAAISAYTTLLVMAPFSREARLELKLLFLKSFRALRRPTILARIWGVYGMAKYIRDRNPSPEKSWCGIAVTQIRNSIYVSKNGRLVFDGTFISDYSEGAELTRLTPDGSGGYTVHNESTGGSYNERLVIGTFRPGIWMIYLFFMQFWVAYGKGMSDNRRRISDLEKEIKEL